MDSGQEQSINYCESFYSIQSQSNQQEFGFPPGSTLFYPVNSTQNNAFMTENKVMTGGLMNTVHGNIVNLTVPSVQTSLSPIIDNEAAYQSMSPSSNPTTVMPSMRYVPGSASSVLPSGYSTSYSNSSTSSIPMAPIANTVAYEHRMPIGMSAQSPGVYSPLSDVSSASSPHVLASRTASFNATASCSSMDSSSMDGVGSTGSANVPLSSMIHNPSFIQSHNFSVKIYQSFKQNVDLLFSSDIPIQEKNQLISSILQTVNVNLVAAMGAEKDYLMNEVLCPWAILQQKYSIAALWTQQQHYHQLDAIDTLFEYFGELLEQTLSGIQYLAEQFPKLGFEEAFSRVRHIAHLFLFYSVVVARQPPAVVVKCGEAENHRRSRFWFNTELRILGGRAFGLHKSAENLQAQCFLITDETAKKLRANAYYEVNTNEHFIIEPNMASFQIFNTTEAPCLGDGGGGAFSAKFDDMRVSKKEQLRREEVWKKRYNLCYNIRIPVGEKYRIELVGKKVSLPFAILVGPKCDVEAKLFLERSFGDFIRQPDLELPVSVHYSDMVTALEMKFQAILETPQKSTDQPVGAQPRAFLSQSRQHIVNRLKPDLEGHVFLENFLKMPVAEEYCVKRGISATNSNASALSAGCGSAMGPAASPTVSDGGEWKLVPFFEWFFKLAELVNKNFVQLWNDGLIFGFCGKDEAEMLLAECQCPTLLIRFSDYEFAKIKISVRDRSGVIRHHWYEMQDLVGRNLNEELLHNAKYRDVEFIYPNVGLEAALGARRSPNAAAAERMRKPRNLQPSPIYFNNQEPAVRLNSF